jgi:LysR family transcriptional regulator, glycine cleavage system transcriptional activator
MAEPSRQAAQAELARHPEDCPSGAPPLARPRRSIPSIAGLVAFEAAARHHSFSIAARDLNLSQGAVSKRVRQLEEVVGVELFVRARQMVSLTAAGTSYLGEIRCILAQLEAATDGLTRRRAERSGISVGVPPDFALHWLIPRLGIFQARHPHITVNLTTHVTGEDRARDDLDAAIRLAATPGAGASATPLLEERLVPMAAPAVLRRLAPTQPADLAVAPRLHLASRPDLWARWFAAAGLAEAPPPSGPSHDRPDLLVAAAVEGHGLALLSQELVARELVARRLEIAFPITIASGCSFVFDAPRWGRRRAEVAFFRSWLLQVASAGFTGGSPAGGATMAACRAAEIEVAAGLPRHIQHREKAR